MDTATAIVAYCRAGFEAETLADLAALATQAQLQLAIGGEAGAGYVIGRAPAFDARAWQRAWRAAPPTFVRSAFAGHGPIALLDAAAAHGRPDRLAPLLSAIAALAVLPAHAPPWREAWVEFPDTNAGKSLSPLARALQARLGGALRDRGDIAQSSERRLHVFVVDGAAAYLGTSEARTGSGWPLGIPRLSMPGRAPSRSTLKLAEAFVTFLGERESAVLRPGLAAVDLGAAPGGWSWQLAQRGLKVTAVDNGALKGDVAIDPRVTHLRADGLIFRPRRPVDWVVCDIVEQPLRIADLMARWIADGYARHAVFNLKLPMKKRYAEVERCKAHIAHALQEAGVGYALQLRHLYHDREEVTGYLARAARA